MNDTSVCLPCDPLRTGAVNRDGFWPIVYLGPRVWGPVPPTTGPWLRTVYLKQAVSAAALAQGLGGGGGDHVLLLLCSPQGELLAQGSEVGVRCSESTSMGTHRIRMDTQREGTRKLPSLMILTSWIPPYCAIILFCVHGCNKNSEVMD